MVPALAAGTVTVYAGELAIPITVYADSLPQGTAMWTVAVDGVGGDPLSIIPAVPSASGADVFAYRSGILTALSSDVSKVWKTTGISGDQYTSPIPTSVAAPSWKWIRCGSSSSFRTRTTV